MSTTLPWLHPDFEGWRIASMRHLPNGKLSVVMWHSTNAWIASEGGDVEVWTRLLDEARRFTAARSKL